MKSESVQRFLLVAVALAAAVSFCYTSVQLNRNMIWFSNLDQYSVILLNALQGNDGRSPVYFDHPAQGAFVLYGMIFRAAHAIGMVPFSKFSHFESHSDPVLYLAQMYYAGRIMSLGVTLLIAALGAVALAQWAGSWKDGVGAFPVFLASVGLLFDSLFVRSEQSAVLGIVTASLFCPRSRFSHSPYPWRSQ